MTTIKQASPRHRSRLLYRRSSTAGRSAGSLSLIPDRLGALMTPPSDVRAAVRRGPPSHADGHLSGEDLLVADRGGDSPDRHDDNVELAECSMLEAVDPLRQHELWRAAKDQSKPRSGKASWPRETRSATIPWPGSATIRGSTRRTRADA